MGNQEIKCNVTTCKYNDATAHCSLDNITVGNDGGEAHTKKETECVSFVDQ